MQPPAQAITLEYLDNFLEEQFSFNVDLVYSGLNGGVTATGTMGASIATADYDVDVIFSADTVMAPSPDDIDVLINAAFLEPFSSILVMLLQDLPSSNPFSQVDTVVYNTI